MKILKIKSRNINSLKGDNEIDFERFLQDDALFSITGTTGAGKSTILDIIICALYGRTPRLNNPIDLMTQHTGECFCEVEFEIKSKRYRSSWSVRRAKDKSEGKVQVAKMEICTLPDEKLISMKSKEVPPYIEKLSGLDFDKFKQSMMLAQNGFDAFLKAKENERSLLLEKMTGTQIYATISREIYSTYKDFNEEIKLEERALGVIELLSKDVISEKKTLLKEKNRDKNRALKRDSQLKKEHLWLKNLVKLKTNYIVSSQNFKRSKEKKEKNRELFSKLELAKKALNIESLYTKRVIVLKDIEKSEDIFKKIEVELKDFKVQLDNKSLEVNLSQKMFEDAKQEYLQKNKKVKVLRAINIEKELKSKRLMALMLITSSQKSESKALNSKLEESTKSLRFLKKENESSSLKDDSYERKYLEMDKVTLEDNQKEYPFKSRLKHLDELIERSKHYNEILKSQKEIETVVNRAKQNRKTLKERVIDKEQLSMVSKAHLKSLRENREQKLLIVKYENDRKILREGEACFLCGSKEHPYIEHQPQVDVDKTTLEIDQKEERLSTIKSKLKLLEKEHIEVIAKIELETLAFEKLEEKRLFLKKSLGQASVYELAEEKKRVEQRLNEIVHRREKKITLLEEKTKSEVLHKQIAKKLHEEEILIKELDVKNKSLKKALYENVTQQTELEDEVMFLKKRAIVTLNILDIDKYEKGLNDKFKTVQDKAYQQEKKYAELRIKEESLRERFILLGNALMENKTQLLQLEKQFSAELKSNKFSSEKAFLEALVKKERRAELSKICDGIQKEYTQSQTLYRDAKQRLFSHQKENLSTALLEDVSENLKALELILDSLKKEIGNTEKELEIDALNRAKHQKRIEALNKKKETFRVWIKLNEMVGSADGAKFAKFAQGITLDQLIYLANTHLEILSSRYELCRSNNERHLLEIEVIDSFQGNVTRPVSTLSGGESFIVSLALALGLSSLASQRISIDSLFLDEGFGSLDDDSLEVALNALSRLQSSGKMIGVISHVKSLKEQIPLQIKIVPNGDGTSRIITPTTPH